MKKLIPFVLYSIAIVLCLGAVTAQAGFVSPRVPPRDDAELAASAMELRAMPNNMPILRIVTNTRDEGAGSLRRAIESAAAGDRIQFALPLPATISLCSTLVITQNLVVLGPGPDKLAVVRSSAPHTPSFRVFKVNAGVVTISGMTIRNGIAFDASSFIDNLGGGIYSRGTLTVSNCVITGNSAPSSSSGGTNSLGFGAGIFSDASPLAVINSTISGNQASAAGGGICTFESTSFLAEGCTVSGNFAGIQGGGLNFQGHVGTLQNCTIAGNTTAEDGAGSGIANVAFENELPPMLTVTACTVAGNTGTTNGAVAIAGLNNGLGLTNRLLSTLVGANIGPNFSFFGTFTFQSLGNNLDSDGTSGLVNGANGDLVGTVASPIDAKLDPLQNNGGPTLTMALLPSSPALGTAACSDAEGAPLTVDQRGLPRPQVTGCDIGAFENQAPTLICPASQTLGGCGSHDSPFASLAATVADPDGDALMVIWSVNGIARQTNYVAATHPPQPKVVTFNAFFSQGTNIVSVWVSDGKAVPMACSTGVIVRDKTPPRILSIKAVPNVLWPANGSLVPVAVLVQAVDDSGPVTSHIISVRSNEPSSSSQPDWVITGDLSLLLRADRSLHGHGRVYTITVQCSDASGNTSTGTALVTVPRDGGGGPCF